MKPLLAATALVLGLAAAAPAGSVEEAAGNLAGAITKLDPEGIAKAGVDLGATIANAAKGGGRLAEDDK
ncbi:hypothetical protein CDD83_662 [Cordyceps sp. RAO-2017]|nr:hypothetical protein CDD83_662 [Cordyceps sp. RAO-2017]